MTYVLPVPLPQSLVDEHQLVPGNDFGYQHVALRWNGEGRGYIHSEVFYNFYRYNRDFRALIVTVLSPTSRSSASTSCRRSCAISRARPTANTSSTIRSCRSPSPDHTLIFDSTFARRLADLPAGASNIIALADGSYVLSQHREC